MFLVCYTKQALRSLGKIPASWRKRIVKATEALAKDPYVGKKLQGQFEGLFSLRVWPYRVIYLIQKSEIKVLILEVGHRQSVYKN